MLLAFLVSRFSSSLLKKGSGDQSLLTVYSSMGTTDATSLPATPQSANSDINNKLIPGDSKTKENSSHCREFFSKACLIMSNRVYIFIVICCTFETFLIKGFSSYLTKYLEYEYRLPASTASVITGSLGFFRFP